MHLNKYNIQYNATLSLIENCAEILKKHPKTLDHVLKVAETGIKLAARFDTDTEKVSIACLLHDISAVIPRDDYIDLCKAYNFKVLPEEEQVIMLLHQKISAIIAKEVFNITDAEILSAIAYHTSLKAAPSQTDMIVFIVDKLSWDQSETPPFFEVVETALETSLETACLTYINYTFDNNMILIPLPDTLAAKKYLEN